MNLIEKSIAAISPGWAAMRARSRNALAYYEATKPGRLRRTRTKDGTGDAAVVGNAAKLRSYARDMERNHDISRGAINALVRNVVGPNGIAAEPQPRTKTGEIHEDFAKQILALHKNWALRPEVTWQHDWASAQRMLARAWFRDGEAFAQRILGNVATLDHGTEVPYSLEMMESDSVPLGYHDSGKGITDGIERNGWGRPTGFWVYRTDPSASIRLATIADLKRIPSGRMLHVKTADRMLQARGLSVFASVLIRLDDVKDYEDSERIAAKVAASMAAMIVKGMPDQYAQTLPLDENGHPIPRNLKFRPGMIFDDLLPGEDIKMIDSKRPNPVVEDFRKGQLRAGAAGLDLSYSTFARDYNGTYSAQRQELVEQWSAYLVLSSEFAGRIVQPVYADFINAAIAAGLLRVPTDLDAKSLYDALYIPPQMPWIDPLKEALAWGELEDRGYASGPEIIRRRGLNPREVLEQQANWKKMLEAKGLLTGEGQVDPVELNNAAQNRRGLIARALQPE